MRHVPSVYFPIFICCNPVNIAGILLSLQKSCHKGIYLETSGASRSRRRRPHHGCLGSVLSLLTPPSVLLLFLESLQPSSRAGAASLSSVQGCEKDTGGTLLGARPHLGPWGPALCLCSGAKTIHQSFSNWVQSAVPGGTPISRTRP